MTAVLYERNFNVCIASTIYIIGIYINREAMLHRSENWWREGDSNSRSRSPGMAVFKTAAFNHSAISPKPLKKDQR